MSSTGGAAGAISVPADGGAGIAGAAGGKTSTTATGGSAGKSGTGGSAGGTGGASVDGGAKDAAIDVNPDSGAGVDGAAPQCLSLSGGTCAALVDGCRACPAGTYLNPTRAGCDEAHAWCCTKVAPEVNECTDGGGLCVPSGAECPDGWKRMRTSCGAGVDSTCCQPDSSVCPVNLGGGCTGRDECDCYQVNGCAMITEECYCTQCDGPRVCNCGGGKFVGCASINLSTCDKAKARLLSVCPIPDSSTWDNLCAQTSPCIAKCLNDVASCDDVACTFCVDCSCGDDRFATCVKTCTAALSD